MKNQLLTCKELAARLKVRPSTIRTWARDGLIPTVRISHKVIRYDFDEVLAKILKRQQAEGGAQ